MGSQVSGGLFISQLCFRALGLRRETHPTEISMASVWDCAAQGQGQLVAGIWGTSSGRSMIQAVSLGIALASLNLLKYDCACKDPV